MCATLSLTTAAISQLDIMHNAHAAMHAGLCFGESTSYLRSTDGLCDLFLFQQSLSF